MSRFCNALQMLSWHLSLVAFKGPCSALWSRRAHTPFAPEPPYLDFLSANTWPDKNAQPLQKPGRHRTRTISHQVKAFQLVWFMRSLCSTEILRCYFLWPAAKPSSSYPTLLHFIFLYLKAKLWFSPHYMNMLVEKQNWSHFCLKQSIVRIIRTTHVSRRWNEMQG
jgi:hypothetical protein